MRKWFVFLMLGGLLVFPSLVSAQGESTLNRMDVQLWPEYDQPSMLVITDFELPPSTSLPAEVTFNIPLDANLIAVAFYTADGGLNTATFTGPQENGEWQTFTITLESTAGRFEYYQPITFNENQRIFSYLWDGSYAVGEFNIRVLEPIDTASLTTDPNLDSISQEDGLNYYSGKPMSLAGGEQFTLNLQYEKTSDTLVAPPQGIQPSAPVDEDTPGRVSLNHSLPYIIGGLGLVMIVGGVLYYLQAGRQPTHKSRKRAHRESGESAGGSSETGSYCPQCGERSKPADRFCRNCGARLRHQEG